MTVSALFMQDDAIYYADLLHNVGFVRTDGSACGLLATAFSSGTTRPGFAIDSGFVYLSDGRNLYRVPRAAHGL